MRSTSRRLVVVAAVLWTACGSPTPPTQVMVRIVADPAVAAQLDTVAWIVSAGPDRDPAGYLARDSGVITTGLPFEMALVPEGGDVGQGFQVDLVATRADLTLLAAARVRSGFVAGRTVLLTIRLEASCIDVLCDAETCTAGACAPIPFVDPATLETYTPYVGEDAGPPVDAGPPPVDELDLLFVVDNTASMAEEQMLLATEIPNAIAILTTGNRPDPQPDFVPVRSLHVGVVSTDLGAGPSPTSVVPSCEPGFGDDGILRSSGSPTLGTCPTSFPSGIFEFNSGDDLVAFASDVTCVAELGTGGCGFPQQLEAGFKAVAASSPTASYVPDGYVPESFVDGSVPHGDGANAGFVRRDSVLAIVLVSNKDDCSVPDYSLFYSGFSSMPLNLRCYDAREVDAPPNALYPVSRYVDGLLALRPYPNRLVYHAIVGVPTDATSLDTSFDAILARPAMIETLDTSTSNVVPSCTAEFVPPGTTTPGFAYPPRRMVTVARDLAARGAHANVTSICAASFVGSIDMLIDDVAAALDGT